MDEPNNEHIDSYDLECVLRYNIQSCTFPLFRFRCTYNNLCNVSASDCFELGRQSYHNRDYYHTVLWMQEAMDRLQEEQNATTTSKPDILEYLAFSTYMQGDEVNLT